MTLNLEPNTVELQRGDELKQALLTIDQTMRGSHIRRTSIDIVNEHLETNRQGLVILPSEAITRTLVGFGEDDEGEHYTVKPIRGWTRKPFVLIRGEAHVGYDSHYPQLPPIVRGRGLGWERGDRKYYLEVLNYQYAFDLSKHALAVMGIEALADN